MGLKVVSNVSNGFWCWWGFCWGCWWFLVLVGFLVPVGVSLCLLVLVWLLPVCGAGAGGEATASGGGGAEIREGVV